MNEEDAQTAALQEYFDSNAPAGYGASFRAGWSAGRIYEVGVYTHGCEAMADQEITVWRDIARASEQRERIATERLRLVEDQVREWERLAREKNWGYVHDERLDQLVAENTRLRAALLTSDGTLTVCIDCGNGWDTDSGETEHHTTTCVLRRN